MSVQALARSLPEIETLDVRRSFDQALETLRAKTYEVILVTDRFEQAKRIDFAKTAREATDGGKDAAFILVLQTEAAGSHMIAGKIVQGTDGILQEPYSADQLIEAIRIAEAVKQQNSNLRKKNAVDIALSDAMTYIEARTSNPNITFNKSVSQKALSKLKATLTDLEQADSEVYFDTIIDKFTKLARKDRKLFEGGYRGASERVKRLMEKKAAKRVEEIAKKADHEEKENSSDD